MPVEHTPTILFEFEALRNLQETSEDVGIGLISPFNPGVIGSGFNGTQEMVS